MAMELVSTIVVGPSGASSIEFVNVPQTGRDLLLLGSVRCTSWGQNLTLDLNNTAPSFFTSKSFLANGTTVNTYASPVNWIGVVNGTGRAANNFTNLEVYISNYSDPRNKVITAQSAYEDDANTAYIVTSNITWANSSDVTSVKIVPESQTWVEHTVLSLYIVS